MAAFFTPFTGGPGELPTLPTLIEGVSESDGDWVGFGVELIFGVVAHIQLSGNNSVTDCTRPLAFTD